MVEKKVKSKRKTTTGMHSRYHRNNIGTCFMSGITLLEQIQRIHMLKNAPAHASASYSASEGRYSSSDAHGSTTGVRTGGRGQP